MKALQVIAPGKSRIVEVPAPGPPPPGHVCIRLRVTSLCGRHEWKVFKGAYRGTRTIDYPCRPGFPGREGAGEVYEIGPDVKTLRPGDRVALSGHACDLHQEYVIAPEKWALKIVSGRPWPALAPADLFARMLYLLKGGEKIFRANAVIIGLGSAGLAALLWLRLLGARKVTGIEVDKNRTARAAQLGIDDIVSATDFRSLDLLGKSRPETVIECSGTHTGIQTAATLAAREVLLFDPNDAPMMVDIAQWMDKGLALKTRKDYDWPFWEETVTCIDRGLIDPGELVSHTLPFSTDSYDRALELFSRREALRIALEFPQEPDGGPTP
jgi:threonine dehydrogenase-like Zn-dependent dehydrogenase